MTTKFKSFVRNTHAHTHTSQIKKKKTEMKLNYKNSIKNKCGMVGEKFEEKNH